MNFLATDGSDLYATIKKDNNNYDWKKFHSIYHKEYSSIINEMVILPNKDIIYDIYILPIWDEENQWWDQYGFQCLFSLIDTSKVSQSFYLEHSNFRLHWNKNGDNKIFITYGTATNPLDFRIRTISTGNNIFLGEKHNIYTGIDIKNKTLNTGIFNNNSVFSVHPSIVGTNQKTVLQNVTVSNYDFILPEEDSKLYLFTIKFTAGGSDSPSFIQFTYANGKMANGRVGALEKRPISIRYINKDLEAQEECYVLYHPDDKDSKKSYLSISLIYDVNYKIASLSYTYLTI